MPRFSRVLSVALATLCTGSANARAQEPTWVEIDGAIYGAKPDKLGPIGGGVGYANVVTKGDYVAEDLDALLAALAKAKAGQVVFIPGEIEIDLTVRMYVEEIALRIPEGVTLAGNRGVDGSKGALLTSDSLKTPAILRTGGPNVRITGLRIQGPDSKRRLEHHKRSLGRGGKGRDYFYKFPTSDGVVVEHPKVEVDNCDLSAFSHAAVFLTTGAGHRIHHDFIHHCQYQGLGYGVCHLAAASLVEFNRFDFNRHSLAGTGEPGCGYVARHNVELGTSLSHCFDMHGGRDREDGTDVAGTTIEIANNTFRAPQLPVKIRGMPQEKCDVHRNWFVKHAEPEKAVGGLSKRTKAFNNAYGEAPTAAK